VSARFDKFMIHVDIGTDEKLADLTDSERLCHIAGVLALAAKSPIRGRLVVGDVPATANHMRKLLDVGVLIADDDLGCLRVHNWERFNPPPKQDTTSAERQARYRRRLREKGQTRAIMSATKGAVMDRDNGCCVACGSTESLEFHHVQAVVDGGGNGADNLELRCKKCHRGRASHGVTDRNVTPSSRPSHADEGEGEVEGTAFPDSGLTADVAGAWDASGDPGPEPPSNVVDFRDGKTINDRGVA
jgi:5-methylcytosine-specific restriction endonuclease McrA